MTRFIVLLCAMGFLSVQANAAEPTVIKPAWEVKLPPYHFFDKSDWDAYGRGAEWIQECIALARALRMKSKQNIIPPNEPIVDDDFVVVSTPRGAFVYSMKADSNAKPPLKEGGLYWYAEDCGVFALNLVAQSLTRSVLEKHYAKDECRPGLVEQIMNHSLNGRIRSYNGLTLMPCEFGLFPPTSRRDDGQIGVPQYFPNVSRGNQCAGLNLETGKIMFRLGRPVRADSGYEFASSFQMSSPLVIAELCYLIAEKEKSLRLYCIDPNPIAMSRVTREPATKFKVDLLQAKESAASDLTRRIHALIPIATDKLIICPTHLGAVVAVNRDDHKVAWTARYGKLEDKRFENFSCTWRVRPVLVAGDLLVYGPADAESLYAFKLADGKEAWKIERGKGVYVAGLHDGKAIVVESNAVRAVDATNGKEVWKVPFEGTLTGYGAFNGDRFFQPIGLGKNADEGVLQAIDLKQGKATGTIQRADKKEFGNLLIHKGKLISQTFESLSVFAMP